jgi:ADP-ribose pyrophosphatase
MSKLFRWQKIAQRYAYQGWRSMLVKTFRLNKGQIQEYDIVENGAYVVVAAFTTKGKAIVVRQFRPGPERVLAGFCEGYVDSDETPEATAARELMEETGYRAGSIRYLRRLHTAYSTEERICLLATDCEWVQNPTGDGEEEIEVLLLSPEELNTFIAEEKNEFTSLDALYLAEK